MKKKKKKRFSILQVLVIGRSVAGRAAVGCAKNMGAASYAFSKFQRAPQRAHRLRAHNGKVAIQKT